MGFYPSKKRIEMKKKKRRATTPFTMMADNTHEHFVLFYLDANSEIPAADLDSISTDTQLPILLRNALDRNRIMADII